MPRSMKAMSRLKKRVKKATVDFSVQRTRRNVNMNQPCWSLSVSGIPKLKGKQWRRRDVRSDISQRNHRSSRLRLLRVWIRFQSPRASKLWRRKARSRRRRIVPLRRRCYRLPFPCSWTQHWFPVVNALPWVGMCHFLSRRCKGLREEVSTYHMPANSCTSPPYPYAIPMTRFGSVKPLVPILIKPRTNVVSAKALKPRGAGLPNLRPSTLLNIPGCNSPPKARAL